MALPHIGHLRTSVEGIDRIRRIRMRLDNPALKTLRTVVGALGLLVVVGVATGQILGHLLATGIDNLLQLIALDQAG